MDRRIALVSLLVGIESGRSGIRIRDMSSGGAELVKRQVGVMRSFGGSWKPAFSRLKIS